MQFKVVKGNPMDVVKQYFWLAWNACGGPLGMGLWQDNPQASLEAVFENVKNAGDYPGPAHTRSDEYYGDYVFGRMMKTGVNVSKNTVKISDASVCPAYQAWCRKYPTTLDLLKAAAEAASCELEEVD